MKESSMRKAYARIVLEVVIETESNPHRAVEDYLHDLVGEDREWHGKREWIGNVEVLNSNSTVTDVK
jgi:hypothetical protein